MKTIENNPWIPTDPDLQWQRNTEENTYEMVEVRASIGDVFYYVLGSVCLEDYSEEDIRDALEGYGYDSSKNYMDSLIDIYGSAPAAKGIIAECLFEAMRNSEMTYVSQGFNSENKCSKAAKAYMKNIQRQEKIHNQKQSAIAFQR